MMDSQQDSQPKDSYHMRPRPPPRSSKARLNDVSPKTSSHSTSAGSNESGLVKYLTTPLTRDKSIATSENGNSWPPVLSRSYNIRDTILQQGITISLHHNVGEYSPIPSRSTKFTSSVLDSKKENSQPADASSTSREAELDGCLAANAGTKKSCLALLGDNDSPRTWDEMIASLSDEDDILTETFYYQDFDEYKSSEEIPIVKGRPSSPLDQISVLPITETANPVPPLDWPAPPPPPVHDI